MGCLIKVLIYCAAKIEIILMNRISITNFFYFCSAIIPNKHPAIMFVIDIQLNTT